MDSVCNICGSGSVKIFDAMLLGKYNVGYFQCENCSFIQTEKPYWLEEAYVSAITSIDVGLVYRNLYFSNIVPTLLDVFSNKNDSYIDYGGGYGMFVRIMRDKGYDFYLQDIYAENLFAKYFDIKDFAGGQKFTALTAFEVFEHLEDPIEELKKMFGLSDTIIFSTDLQPMPSFSKATDWWYFTPETGQHISFYNIKSLEKLSQLFNCRFYSNGKNLHIITKLNLSKNPFAEGFAPFKSIQNIFSRVINKITEKDNKRISLLQQDFEFYKKKVYDHS